MKSSALALAEAQPEQAPQPAATNAVMRDFSQPWLDLNDKSVLVTGGTGSFGKHFLKTVIAQYKPRRLIIFVFNAGFGAHGVRIPQAPFPGPYFAGRNGGRDGG